MSLLSSSSIVTVVLAGSPTVTSVGREEELIARVKVSFLSHKLSSFIPTLNETLVIPAGNVTVYGPEL